MSIESKKDFSFRLRYLRKENIGVSIDKISNLASTSNRSWIYYENGNRYPSLELFLNLKEKGILMDMNYLVYGRVSPNYLSESELKLISRIREGDININNILDFINMDLLNDNKNSEI